MMIHIDYVDWFFHNHYYIFSYYEHKKEWEKANSDLKKCQSIININSNSCSNSSGSGDSSSAEEKAIVIAIERIKKEIQKEKNQAKKTWGKVFG